MGAVSDAPGAQSPGFRVDAVRQGPKDLYFIGTRCVTLPPATIHNVGELGDWLQQSRATIGAAPKEGPVIN